MQVLLVIMAVLGFRALAYIRGMLVPGIDPKILKAARGQRRLSAGSFRGSFRALDGQDVKVCA